MGSLANVTSYQGRTVDLGILQGSENSIGVMVPLVQSLTEAAAPGGILVTGLQKLAQRFLLILLTEQNTLTYLPANGCRFMADARSGIWRTAADVTASFQYSLIDIKRQLSAIALPTDPLDELLLDAILLNVSLDAPNQVSLSIALTTQAGTSGVFIAPINVTTG